MRRVALIILAAAALVLAACTTATPVQNGGGATSSGVAVSDAWVRPAPGGQGNGAAYLLVRSSGSAGDRLVQAASDVADSVELHTAEMKDGVMSMRPVEGIDVPAGGTAELKPGGYHIMLIGLRRELQPGERVALTLQFERAGQVSVEAVVRPQ